MANVRGKSTPEFERRVVAMATDQGLSVAAVARRFGLSEGRLREWKKLARAQGADAFPGRATRPPPRRNSAACARTSSDSRWSATS